MKTDAIRLTIKDNEALVIVKTKGVWIQLVKLDRRREDSITILSKDAKRVVDKALAKFCYNKYHDGD